MTENNDRFSRWAEALPLWLTQLSGILSRKPPLAGIPGLPSPSLLQQRVAAERRHDDFFVAALAKAETSTGCWKKHFACANWDKTGRRLP